MSRKLRVLRLAIVVGYLAVGLGVGLALVGPYALIGLPIAVMLLEPAFAWATGWREQERFRASVRAVGRDALTSDQMDTMFRQRTPRVVDDDPKWGKLVEGRDDVWGQSLTAVQVTNATPEPDGSYKKVWLRVPARGDRQGTRTCTKCGKDIAWAPRTAKEAIAWTFRMCVTDYKPAKAS